jgi:hypothetical protein
VTLVVVFAVSAFVIGFDALMSSLRKFHSVTIAFFWWRNCGRMARVLKRAS